MRVLRRDFHLPTNIREGFIEMNWVDHLLRKLVLDGTATPTLSTGTEEVLYPFANLWNARPGVPFRCQDTSIKLLFDLGSAIGIDEVLLLQTNLENITTNAIRIFADAFTPPTTLRGSATLLGADDDQSDFTGTAFLYPAAFIFGSTQTFQHWLIELTQTNRQATYTQIGELWFEQTGSHAWYDSSKVKGQPGNYDRPVIADSVLSRERQAGFRGARITTAEEFRAADIAGAATLLETAFRSQPLAFHEFEPASFRARYGGRLSAFSVIENYQDDWNMARQVDSIIKVFAGDGKI